MPFAIMLVDRVRGNLKTVEFYADGEAVDSIDRANLYSTRSQADFALEYVLKHHVASDAYIVVADTYCTCGAQSGPDHRPHKTTCPAYRRYQPARRRSQKP